MIQQPSHTDALQRARDCLAAYGSDLRHWPEEDRDKFGDLALSEALRAEREGAAILDKDLSVATQPSTPHDLGNRIMAGFPAQGPANRQKSILAWIEDLFSSMGAVPAGAMASFAVVGFALGVTTAEPALSPEFEALAYLETGSDAAFDDEGGVFWVAE